MAKTTDTPPAEQQADSHKIFLRYTGPDIYWMDRAVWFKNDQVWQFTVVGGEERPELPGHPSWWLPVDTEAIDTTVEELPGAILMHRIWTPEELQHGALEEDWPGVFYPNQQTPTPTAPEPETPNA